MLPLPENPWARRGQRGSSSSVSSMAQPLSTSDIPGGYPESIAPSPTTAQQSLAQAVHARRAEYTKPQAVRIKVGSWNVAAKNGTELDVGGWLVGGKGVARALTGLTVDDPSEPHDKPVSGTNSLEDREGVAEQEQRRTKKESTIPKNDPGEVPGGEDVGIYVLGLQEIVDVTSPTEALRPYGDPTAGNRYKKAMEKALPPGYELVAEQQLVGLFLLIYAAPEVAPLIRNVSTTSVGTGLMGYMGNKGAVTARFVLGDTTRLVFINSHMGAGHGKAELERRNWDASQILSRTKFEPIVDSFGITQEHGERIGDEDFAFWFGDLNYRLEGIPGEDVRRLLMLHTRNEYDIGSRAEAKIEKEIEESKQQKSTTEAEHTEEPSSTAIPTSTGPRQATANDGSILSKETVMGLDDEALEPGLDPASLQTTIDSLLPHDELRQQQKMRKMFHDGWREGPITFLPTYKYDVGSVGVFDTGEKRRGPSWTDRILYRTRKDIEAYEDKMKEEVEARKRDDEMKAQGIDSAGEDEDMLFEYDPDADGEEAQEEAPTSTGEPPETIVTKEGFEDVVALEYYISHQRVLSSDHKPLNAIFTLKYDAVIPDVKSKIHQEVAKEMDRAENEGRPVVAVVVDGETDDQNSGFNGVDFGDVRFKEPKFHSATIANTGRSLAQFGFAYGPETEEKTRRSMPEWVKAQVELESDKVNGPVSAEKPSKSLDEWRAEVPKSFTLQPGETCNVRLVCEINDMTLVKRLNEDQPLEDVLVLRVREGRDHFIPVHGKWQRSSQGSTLDKLVRLPEEGIRKLQRQKPKDVDSGSEGDDHNTVVWSAPREIFRLTEAIESLVERIIAEWGMRFEFGSDNRTEPPWNTFAGWPFVEESWALKDVEMREAMLLDIREALDINRPFDEALPKNSTPLQRVEVLSEALLEFLHNLEDGVVTAEMWSLLETEFFSSKVKVKLPVDERKTSILEIIGPFQHHSVTFILLTSMLVRICQELSGGMQEIPAAPSRSSNDLPASPKVSVKRKSLANDPTIARRQLIQQNLAAVFADVLIRLPDGVKTKNKHAQQDRRRELIQTFLENESG